MPKRSIRAAVTGAVCLLVALPLSRAQENKEQVAPASAGTTASEDALARAQRDYDAIKGLRNGTLQAKPDLLRVDVPEWQSGGMPRASTPLKITTPENKSANWLLDAMKKEPKERDRQKGERDDRLREESSSGLEMAGDRVKTESTRSDMENREAKDTKPTRTDVVNPLTRYLGEWMTPQDYALLKPGMVDTLGPRTDVKLLSAGATGVNAAVSGLLTPPGDVSLAALAASPIPPPSSAPRENPYLSTLSSASSPMLTMAPAPKPAFNPPVTFQSGSGVVAPLAPVVPPPSKIPDFVKPATDEKYFKPLKRF